MTDETIARLRISLNDTDPEIWRVVDVPLTASLKMLHDIVQAAMGWEDYHLWEFETGDRRYGLPDPEWPDDELAAAKNIKLGALIERGVREMTYTYDMGDNWEHAIAVEAVRPGDPDAKYPRFIDGARRCPPEDVGGVPGYENFLEAIADPDHEEHGELRQWYGGPYDPDDIDELITKRRVAAIAIRRAAGKAAYAKRQT
jgi:hypothetical protein